MRRELKFAVCGRAFDQPVIENTAPQFWTSANAQQSHAASGTHQPVLDVKPGDAIKRVL
jgi:hypothetical protein